MARFTNSNLISYSDTNCEVYAPRQNDVSRVTVHCAEGKFSLLDYSRLLRMGISASWNYAIDYEGNIGLFVYERYITNGTGDGDNDSKTINIQVSTNNSTSPWTISDITFQSLLNLCEDIARRNNIKSYTFNTEDNSNITLHRWYDNNTQCPYSAIESKIPSLVRLVNSRLQSKTPSADLTKNLKLNPTVISNTTDIANQSGNNVYDPNSSKSQLAWDTLDIESLMPYIITANRSSSFFMLNTAKGVSGVLLEAGYLFDNNHIKQNNFRNPNLTNQINTVKNAKLSVSFYMYGRARTESEAQMEISELSKILRINPPKFGVWIIPEMNQSKVQNDRILDVYKTKLQNLGFTNKIGLYATPQQLSTISWDYHQNYWYLWLVNHVSDESKLTDRVDNTFFGVE